MKKIMCLGLLAVSLAVYPGNAQAAPSAVLDALPQEQARAVFTETPPRIDGLLDEPFWQSIPVISEFKQREPVDGALPTERTEVRIAYDADNLYFGFMLYDSEPELIRRSILQREGQIDQDDHIWIALDTYNDDRNAYIFELNSFGTQGDALFSDESLSLSDWNWEGVYRSEARITPEGWSLEVAIPFTTIRFSEAEAPEMGIAIRRAIRRKNEEVYWPHIPQEFRGGITTVSQYATLYGLTNLRKGRYMEMKPFAIGGAQQSGSTDTDFLSDMGIDFKYALTSSMTLDLTYNTDFAQVEADNVQINLTRFNLFFPEKREFFLERAGLFSFGKSRDTEIFFSRRIGLENSIIGGGRVTGQVGAISIGVLSLNTDDLTDGTLVTPGGNNSVVRLRADVLTRTTIGAIFTSVQNGAGHNRVVGADAQLRFWNSSSVDGWFARVWDSESGTSSAGAVNLALRPSRSYSLAGAFQTVDANFDPRLGFVRRRDMVKYSGTIAWTPRFENSQWARSLVSAVILNRIDGERDGEKQSTSQFWHNMLSLHSGDFVVFNVQRRFERLEDASAIQGRPLAPGDYAFTAADISLQTNKSRKLSGRINGSLGDFWSGTRTSYGGALTWKTGPYLTMTGSISRNDVDLPVEDGDFSTTILSMNFLGAVSRDLFANALVQWDDVSRTLRSNIRVNWIHTPGSDLFVVLDTGYSTGEQLDPRASRWLRRTGIVKLTYMRAF